MLFVRYLIYKARLMAQWWSVALVTPRTWVRSQVLTPLSYYFFFNNYLQCQCWRCIIRLQNQTSTRPNGDDQWPQSEEHDALSQQRSMPAQKSIRPWINGPQIAGLYLHFGDCNPPRFAKLFYFLCFLLFLFSFKLLFS